MEGQVELNRWQRIAEATNYLVTPANVIDAVGAGAKLYGVFHLTNWRGIIVGTSGYGTDYVDGKVARATGTAGPLGEAIDAAGDKIALASALYKMNQQDLAPKWLLGLVALQNGTNAVMTGIDRAISKIDSSDPVVHPSRTGKVGFFIQELGLGMHVIGSKLAESNQRRARRLKVAGSIVSLTGVGIGSVATKNYAKILFHRVEDFVNNNRQLYQQAKQAQ